MKLLFIALCLSTSFAHAQGGSSKPNPARPVITKTAPAPQPVDAYTQCRLDNIQAGPLAQRDCTAYAH